jgi:hypothetical protein
MGASAASTDVHNQNLDTGQKMVLQREKNTEFIKEMADQFKNNKRSTEGLAMLEKFKDDIDQATYDDIKVSLEEGAGAEFAQTETDKIMRMNLGEKDALAYARENYKDQKRDDVVERVKLRYKESKRIDKETRDESTRYYWNQILDIQAKTGRGVNARETMNDQLELANKMADPSAKAAAIRQINQRAMGQDTVTDPVIWSAYLRQSVEDPEGFKNEVLEHHLDKLSPADFKQLRQWQSDMIAGDGAGATDAEIRAIVNDFGEKEIRGEKLSDEQRAKFYRKLHDEVYRQEATTNQQVRQIAYDLMREGELYKDWWPDPDKYKFEAEEGDIWYTEEEGLHIDNLDGDIRSGIIQGLKDSKKRGYTNQPLNQKRIAKMAIAIEKMPKEHRDAITKQFKKNKGKEPTEAQIVEMYVIGLERDEAESRTRGGS